MEILSVKYAFLKLLIMILPPFSVAKINISITAEYLTNLGESNLSRIDDITLESKINHSNLATPLLANDKYHEMGQSPIHQRTILLVSGLFPKQLAQNEPKALGSEARNPEVSAYSVDNSLQGLVKRLLQSTRSESLKRDDSHLAHRNERIGEKIQLATTTSRPAYDQIPRPLLFDGDFDLDIAATEPDVSVQYD